MNDKYFSFHGYHFYLRRSHQRRAPQVNKSFFSSSFSFSNYQILAYNAYFRLLQGYLVTFLEIWLPGKVWLPGKMTSRESHTRKRKFPGNVSSQEMWLPGKWDFLGNVLLPSKSGKSVNFREMSLHGKCYFPENVTFWEMWLSGKFDFQGNVTSWNMWLPGKCNFLRNNTSREEYLLCKSTFSDKVNFRE